MASFTGGGGGGKLLQNDNSWNVKLSGHFWNTKRLFICAFSFCMAVLSYPAEVLQVKYIKNIFVKNQNY